MADHSGHVYKIEELVGSSPDGVQQAIDNAIARAGETLRNLEWFEVRQVRGNIQEGSVAWYQATVAVGFRVEDPD